MGKPFVVAKKLESKKVSRNDLEDLIEAEQEEVKEAYGDNLRKKEEIINLIEEIAAETNTQPRRTKGKSLIVPKDQSHQIHVKLFGPKVG